MPKKVASAVLPPETLLPLELLPIASLRPHPRNDGRHPPEERAHLRQSIAEHGIYRNVVVANDGTILAGHGVIEAAREAGHTHVPGHRKPFGSKAVRGTIGASGIPARHPLKHDNRKDIPIAVGKYAPVIGDDSTETAIQAATFFLTTYPDAIQIWWGGNYYADALPASSCWLVWDKETTGNFADCELAWTNQDKAARLFHHRWNGMLRASEHERRWHPTQKPAALAAWVYETLGQEGDVILDPFLGSAPSLLAAEQTNRVVYGCELSLEYIAIALERWHNLTGEQPKPLA